MNIILITETTIYRDRPPKVLLDMFSHYEKKSNNNVTIIWVDQWRKWNKERIKKLNPHIVIFADVSCLDYAVSFRYVFDLKIHISCIGIDYFYFERVKKCKWIQKCNSMIHLGKCEKLLDKYRSYFKNKQIISTKSRFVNTERFKDWKLEKKYDILLYGSINMNLNYQGKNVIFYPLRIKLKNILEKLKNKYNIYIVPEFSTLDKRIIANEELSKLINQSYLSVATTGAIESIPFFKYNEISASNSFLLGDIPEDYRELYEGNIVEVTLEMSEEEIIKKIDEALKDKDKLIEKTNKFSEKIRKEHNLDEFTKELDNIIEELLR